MDSRVLADHSREDKDLVVSTMGDTTEVVALEDSRGAVVSAVNKALVVPNKVDQVSGVKDIMEVTMEEAVQVCKEEWAVVWVEVWEEVHNTVVEDLEVVKVVPEAKVVDLVDREVDGDGIQSIQRVL